MFAGGREGFIRDRSPRRRNSRERIGGWGSPLDGRSPRRRNSPERIGGWGGSPERIGDWDEAAADLQAAKDEAAKDKAALAKTVLEMEKKRKAFEAEKEALNEKIFLLLPPKSVKNDYLEQNQAKYIFRCSDGDIQIPDYAKKDIEFLNHPKCKQSKAREVHENGNIYNYKEFPRASVKYFTDALFGIMPKCNDIVETLYLMTFLLFEGQADKDFGSDFEITFLENIWKQLKRMVKARLGQKGTALVVFYLLSLNKDEFMEYALELSALTTLNHCYATAWMITIGKSFGGEYFKVETFLKEHCEGNKWKMDKWLKTQSDKAESLFKPKANVQASATNQQ